MDREEIVNEIGEFLEKANLENTEREFYIPLPERLADWHIEKVKEAKKEAVKDAVINATLLDSL